VHDEVLGVDILDDAEHAESDEDEADEVTNHEEDEVDELVVVLGPVAGGGVAGGGLSRVGGWLSSVGRRVGKRKHEERRVFNGFPPTDTLNCDPTDTPITDQSIVGFSSSIFDTCLVTSHACMHTCATSITPIRYTWVVTSRVSARRGFELSDSAALPSAWARTTVTRFTNHDRNHEMWWSRRKTDTMKRPGWSLSAIIDLYVT